MRIKKMPVKILIACRLFLSVMIFLKPISLHAAQTATAYFAAGCFWCAEHDFEKVPGIEKVISGYTGGKVVNPTYEQVSKGVTGHFESVEVIYNPEKITYQKLLEVFWHNVDPTDGGGQFCDRGDQYRAAIFYSNAEQKKIAQASKNALIKSGQFNHIATLILPASTFYPAEAYHQAYATKNPLRYKYYRYSCGRDQRLEKVWGHGMTAY